MFFYVRLTDITDNRFQERSVIDWGTVADLALSIQDMTPSLSATKGLLQVPSGRLVEAESGNPVDVAILAEIDEGTDLGDLLKEQGLAVELVFGHRRRLGFRLLSKGDEDNAAQDLYSSMPLNLGNYDDEHMALSAIRENADREPVSDMDRARAFLKLMTTFDWTQEEVAEKVGITRQTVSNLVRLVNLDKDWQEALEQGAITARQAMAVLPVMALPETVCVAAWQKQSSLSTAAMLAEAMRGKSSTDLRATAQAIKTTGSRAFYHEHAGKLYFDNKNPLPVPGVRFEACFGPDHLPACDYMVRSPAGMRCGDPDCFDKKKSWTILQLLAEVAAQEGLPVLEGGVDWGTDHFFYPGRDDKERLAQILKDGCPNLYVGFSTSHDALGPSEEGIVYVCRNGKRECTCVTKARAADQREMRRETNSQADERKTVLQEAKARVERRVVEEIGPIVGAALLDGGSVIWSELRKLLHPPAERDQVLDVDAQIAAAAVGEMMARSWRGYAEANIKAARRNVGKVAIELGLVVPWFDEGDDSQRAHPWYREDTTGGWGWCCPDCRTELGEIVELKRRDDVAICSNVDDCTYTFRLDDIIGDWERGPLGEGFKDIENRHVRFETPPVTTNGIAFCPICQPVGGKISNLVSHPDPSTHVYECDHCSYSYDWGSDLEMRQLEAAKTAQATDAELVYEQVEDAA
jgi:ParB family chromosome partitioning protein